MTQYALPRNSLERAMIVLPLWP